MILKNSGSAVLAVVSIFSLFLAVSVYYAVDNIVRPNEDIENENNSNEGENKSDKLRAISPLTEALYHQLFQTEPLEVCPIYLNGICKWNMHKNENETTEHEDNTNTTKTKLKKLNFVIRRSCQIFGIVKYQDVCFSVGEKITEDSLGKREFSQILKDCTHVNDNGYPCTLMDDVKSENQSPKNVCVSDSKSFKNVITQRCRFREKLLEPNNIIIPLEDIVYEEVVVKKRDEESGQSDNAIGDNNHQYKSGSNKTTIGTNATTVVCHILLAALLIVSASVALFEVCRDRLTDKKLGQQSIIGDGRINTATGSRSYSLDSRRCSLVDLTVSRHARRESIQQSAVQQQVDLQETTNFGPGPIGVPRHSHTKLLGARPPPLLRRSSFPVHIGASASISHHSSTPKERISTPSGMATPTKVMSRRTSVDGSEDDSSPDTARRRVRFLRRH